MKPRKHAETSARKHGGKPEDYQALHDFFDKTKAVVADMRHRIFLHNAFGIFLLEQQFGETMTNSDGKIVSVRTIGEEHVLADMGFIPSLQDVLERMGHRVPQPWMGGVHRQYRVVEREASED